MIRKGLLYLTAAFVLLLLVNLAIALIPPPPPVNQDVGIYDTVYDGFIEDECRECHSSGVNDTHHLLVRYKGYRCMDCHELGRDGDEYGVNVINDCLVCHDSSPHHTTDAAQNLICSHCHGSVVDDTDDGHRIPTYSYSMVTPNTSYKIISDTNGLKIGGCEACHEPDYSATPGINASYETHHSLGFDCVNCHLDATGTRDIRKCENCHGIRSLHNIQYDYDTTNGTYGFGHIGDDMDCLGCHAEWDYYSVNSLSDTLTQTFATTLDSENTPSFIGPIVPQIDYINPGGIITGQNTTIIIGGNNFVNTYGEITYTSNVVLDNDQVLIPDSINSTVIEVTIPGTLEPGNYGLWVVKDGSTQSNKASLNVLSEEPLFIVVERKLDE